MWRVEQQMVKRVGTLAPPSIYLCTCLDPSVGVRGGLQNGALRRPELRADLHGGAIRPLCVPRTTVWCRESAAALSEPRSHARSARSFVTAVRLLDLRLRAHRAHAAR